MSSLAEHQVVSHAEWLAELAQIVLRYSSTAARSASVK